MATILAKTVHGCRRAGLIGIALLALGSASPAQSADTTMITIQNYAFMPPELVVKPGTTVTWVNKDDSPHTITSTDRFVASKAMDTDDQYSVTFEQEGDYKYFCTLHPYMVGLVKVRAQ